jgi:hypothetical protein
MYIGVFVQHPLFPLNPGVIHQPQLTVNVFTSRQGLNECSPGIHSRGIANS